MKKIEKPLFILVFFFLFIGCKNHQSNKENIPLKLMTTFAIETMDNNELINSKIAFSDSVILIKSNSYNHTSPTVSDSAILLFLKGKKIATNESFFTLKKRFHLKQYPIDSILFSKPTDENISIILKSKKGNIYRFYNENHNTEKILLELTTIKKTIKTFTLDTKKGTPVFILKDITGDEQEELFFTQWVSGYWGNTYYFEIFEIE